VEVNRDVVTEKDTITIDSMDFYGIDALTGTREITVQGGLIKTLNFSFSDETLADLGAAPFVEPEDIVGMNDSTDIPFEFIIDQRGMNRIAIAGN